MVFNAHLLCEQTWVENKKMFKLLIFHKWHYSCFKEWLRWLG
jgi:hypothetical protein